MKEKKVSHHKLLTNSHTHLLQKQTSYISNELKRKRKEEEYFSKKKSKKKGKIGIFIHVVGERADEVFETVSCLYKIEMDSDKYLNPSPPLMSYKNRFKEPKHKSKPHGINPVFCFNFKQGYPLGMACVHFGSKHKNHLYFMGGSIAYKLFFTKSRIDAYNLYEKVNATDPNMYPPHVYVFDCFTCQLLPRQDSPPPMNSGKSADPFTFIENRKLYVLSSSTKVPKELHMFEMFDPDSRTWTILDNPPYDWGKLCTPLGSLLINGVFFVSYAQDGYRDSPVHIFSYNIANKEWNQKLSVYRPSNPSISAVPSFERDSVFVQKKIYSPNVRQLMLSCFDFPILSYGPIPTTAKLDAYDFDLVATPNLTPIFPLDTCWPIYDSGIEGDFSARLVHLGGLLDGTKTNSTCFSLVQVVRPVGELGCHIRLVAFEASNCEITCDSDTYMEAADSVGNWDLYDCGPFFKAKTLHACHFYSSDKIQRGRVNAVSALVLP